MKTKKIHSRILCIIICMAFSFPHLASCSQKQISGLGTNGETTSADTPLVTTPNAPAEPTLPDNTGSTAAPSPSNPPSEPEPEPEPEPFDEFLVSKWDFEGDDPLADKANGGLMSESVSVFGDAEAKNGILTVPSEAGSYAKIDCPQGSDLYDLKEKTVVFKARVNNDFTFGYQNHVAAIFSKADCCDLYFSGPETERLCQFRYFANAKHPYYISNIKTPLDEWRVYAITSKYSEDSGLFSIYYMRSKVEAPQSGKDFELIFSKTLSEFDDTIFTGSSPLFLGKRFDHTNETRLITSDIAELRIYGKTMTASELASIPFPSSRELLLKELSWFTERAEELRSPSNRSQSDIENLKNAIAEAKDITLSSTESDIKAALSKLSHELSISESEFVRDKIGDLTLIPYNNPELDVPIAVGLHAYPGFYDIDGDGDMDFVAAAVSRSYGGAYGGVFMVYNNKDGVGATHFSDGEVLQYSASRPRFSYKTDGTPVFVDEHGYMFEKLTYNGLEDGRVISGLTRSYKLYDIDGDGRSDAVFAANNFSGDIYDENGKSLEVSISGLDWIKNTGTEEDPVFNSGRRKVLNSSGERFQVSDEWMYTYFNSFSMFDWDGDGDLDLIAGGYQNEFYYYENKGNRTKPVFDADGVRIETGAGALKLDVCRYNVINYDHSGDGRDDLVIGTESGTSVYLVFNGFNEKTGAPVFIDRGYMMTDAEHLWVNALSRPTACDFDGDGDTDFIVGDNCGLLWFYENLTGGAEPSFAYPVKMRDENGDILVIKAGYNGSFQGTSECEWGYTVPVACDWDGDGDIDIVANSVTGRIVWFENIGTMKNGQLTRPKAIEVEWTNGNKYPEWLIWLKPEGNELITQHRTTPFATDLNGDGLTDIVMLDHEGYLAFFERYKEGGELLLKEGERIFYLDGAPLRLNEKTGGQSGRIKFIICDWDGDGFPDILVGNKTVVFYKNVGISDGKYHLEEKGELSLGSIAGHHHGFTEVDFNGDGKPDIVTGSESGYFYYLENNT